MLVLAGSLVLPGPGSAVPRPRLERTVDDHVWTSSSSPSPAAATGSTTGCRPRAVRSCSTLRARPPGMAATTRPVVVLLAEQRGRPPAVRDQRRVFTEPPDHSIPPGQAAGDLAGLARSGAAGTSIAVRLPRPVAPGYRRAAQPGRETRSGRITDVTSVQHLIGVPVPTWAESGSGRRRGAAQGEYQRQGRGTFLGDELVGPDGLDLDSLAPVVMLQAEQIRRTAPPARRRRYEGMVDLAAEFPRRRRRCSAGRATAAGHRHAADVVAACWSQRPATAPHPSVHIVRSRTRHTDPHRRSLDRRRRAPANATDPAVRQRDESRGREKHLDDRSGDRHDPNRRQGMWEAHRRVVRRQRGHVTVQFRHPTRRRRRSAVRRLPADVAGGRGSSG
ncbi:hypothetical protein HBB16_13700 [Pseudonocardia sp. MCCB 268]|nr:hypothetical protein [Pseudonocardia cytotoxica]